MPDLDSFASLPQENFRKQPFKSMPIIIDPLCNTARDDVSERRCVLVDSDQKGGESRTELWFQFVGETAMPDDDDCDAYLLATIMDAMKRGRDIHLKGSVSQSLLGNLIEYQSAWAKWLPGIYCQIDIVADVTRKHERKIPGAVCAFSGGVDATFSVWRHTKSTCSHWSRNISRCAIVHGFDIPLKDEPAFDVTLNRSRRTLSDIGIPLYSIKTNYRTISSVSWEHSHATALVAALSCLKRSVGECIIGSTEPYDALVIPWGSNPITDHLLSSGDFQVIHDGASHSRSEKVREIADWEAGARNLRVCWQGDHKDRNCGRCEKCVRTKLNFLAAGLEVPECFPASDLIADIRRISLRNDVERAYWSEIEQFAKKNGIAAEWVRHMRSVLYRRKAVDRLAPRGSTRRRAIKWVLKKRSTFLSSGRERT